MSAACTLVQDMDAAFSKVNTRPEEFCLPVHLEVKLVTAKKNLTQVLANDYPIKESADIISFGSFINLDDNKTDEA